jgi:tetratricopeptide (TPR) repeat protein
VASLQEAAVRAFSERDFASATASLRRLTDLEPSNPSWREALGQCLVDSGTTASEFRAAAAEFDAALALTASGDAISSARLLAGRALAREGSSEWTAALADYDAALATAASAGLPPDPFILNSRGNALAALGEYASARAAYLDAASGFRGASATRRERETSNAVRSDGVAFAAANAALALAQLGDLAGAKEEMRRVSRKAPGVVDARAALAALYWGEGDGEDAEREWEFACDKISVGCAKYRDEAWVRGVRRWPPKMADLLDDFLNLREPSEARFFAG